MKGIKEIDLPADIQLFYSLIEDNADENYIDFFYSEDRKNRSKNLIGFDSDELIYVGNTKGADYFFIYPDDQNKDILESPLAYISSEGEPWDIFAQNFGEFLSLLFFGTSIIPEAINNINAYQNGIGIEGVKEKFMNEEYLLKLDKLLTSTYTGFSRFKNLLENKLHVNKAISPVDLIFRAKSKNPSFNQWILNKSTL
jgi:hypothetical protein